MPRSRVVALLLIVAALAPFARSLTFGYVFDDTFVIRSNPDLRGWASLFEVWRHVHGGDESPFHGLYRPVTMTLFAIVWNLGGGWPLWFHVLALTLHLVATLLVWRVLERGIGWRSAVLAALWFAVHPVHVEAVANIANSSEVLVAIFSGLLTLHLLSAAKADGPVGWRPAVISGALYLGAFLSKESGAVSAPLAAIVVWGWSRDSLTSAASTQEQLWRWRRVLLAFVVAAAIAFTLRALVLGGPVTGDPIAARGIDELSAPARMWAMASLGPMILRLLAWPVTPNPHYGPAVFPESGASAFAAATVVTVLAAIGLSVALAARGERRPLVGVAWLLLAFLPASNLLVPTGQILAERTLYLPSVGGAMLVGLAIGWIVDREGSPSRAVRVARPITMAGMAAIALIFAGRSARWTQIWRNHETLFAQMIAADTSSYVGYWFSGVYEARNNRVDRALPLLERAYAMDAGDPGLKLDLSDALLQLGRPRQAANIAAGLVSHRRYGANPRAVSVYLEAVGRAYGPDSVVSAGRRLLSSSPSATASLFTGRALELMGDSAAATAVYRKGLQAFPRDSALAARLVLTGRR